MSAADNAEQASRKMLAKLQEYNNKILGSDDIEESIIERVNAATELRDILQSTRKMQELAAKQHRHSKQSETTDEV